MQDIRTSTFAGSPLDRSTPFTPTKANPHQPPPLPSLPTLFVILSPSLHFLAHSPAPSAPETVLFPAAVADALTLSTADTLSPPPRVSHLLGTTPTHQHHALHLPKTPSQSELTAANVPGASFRAVRHLAAMLDSADAAITAHAKSLVEFHIRHAYCGLCGAATVPDRHGTRRRCIRNTTGEEPIDVTRIVVREPHPADRETPLCRGIWFPRTDPVAIMLVVNRAGTHVLLARQKRFPNGWFSCLAGFMEHGEGVEDTVRREVMEEARVNVGRVRFFGSQPWPFPYSLMLGCIAEATADNPELAEVNVDELELEDARWFSKELVQEMVKTGNDPAHDGTDGALACPPARIAIAGQMCAAFADSDPITFFAKQEALLAHKPQSPKGML